jgi:hypothetical protein
MAEQVVERVEADLLPAQSRPSRMSYFDWLALWLEQFDHWHDPVRSLVASHCAHGDAAEVAAQFPLFSGLAFADFVLAGVEAFDERQTWQAAVMGEPQPTRSLPVDVRRVRRATAMERICHSLFEEFQEQAGVATADAPLEFSLASLVGDIYANVNDQSPQIVVPGVRR